MHVLVCSGGGLKTLAMLQSKIPTRRENLRRSGTSFSIALVAGVMNDYEISTPHDIVAETDGNDLLDGHEHLQIYEINKLMVDFEPCRRGFPMTDLGPPVTVTTLVAAATETLEELGYSIIESTGVDNWHATVARVYEDPYSIVCIAVYETWRDLCSSWINDQANLVGLISNHLSRTDAKAWEKDIWCCSRRASSRLQTGKLRPRYKGIPCICANYSRQLANIHQSTQCVKHCCLSTNMTLKPRNALDALPSVLARHGVDETATRTALRAFLNNLPRMSGFPSGPPLGRLRHRYKTVLDPTPGLSDRLARRAVSDVYAMSRKPGRKNASVCMNEVTTFAESA